ncbi:DUF3176 domain-containing protein [Aspergillus glaucus CBS 516.65]|uniref:DUF3176 domain containing protein n=1 Tax=Aspergillus glaucus CBS 516.65 TaxID=1160497 RepID=A0A1L9V3D6_ASPGL|nr:hypothetical protein ASPGLDRAFT_40810 [Aspergillus glaucus CBS 516.65]OJJ78426.1 hypothetical protein ASPGLDRAFT_40810 [Aspergillus glaucus CBS 516.65]
MELKKVFNAPQVNQINTWDLTPVSNHASTSQLFPSPDSGNDKRPDSVAAQLRIKCGWKYLTMDTWYGETFLLTFSFFSFLAIVVVLAVYDEKPSPSLKWGLKLNTIISILATACKSSLIFVVSEAMGQLKWIWFWTGKRKLKSLQTIDEASRGPLGSVSVLFSRPRKGRALIMFGAAITLLALAFEAFMQQIVSYPVRQVDDDTGQAVAKRNEFLFDLESYGDHEEDIVGAIYAGVWTTNFRLDPTCPSGNCTWPPFQSIGWCSQCEDITSQATLANCTDIPEDTDMTEPHVYPCNVTVPGGNWASFPIHVSKTRGVAMLEMPTDMVWTVGIRPLGEYAGVENPLVVLAYAKMHDYPVSTPSHPEKDMKIDNVTQCVLSPCMRTYSVSVSGGNPTTHLSPPSWGELVDDGRNISDSYNAVFQSTAGNLTAGVSSSFVYNFKFLHDSIEFATLYNYYGNDMWNQSGETYEDSLRRLQVVGAEEIMQNLAASLTRYGLENSTETVHGTMSVSRVYVSVEWEWITLPAIVLLASIALFISTVVKNKKHGLNLWKSAILPVLYHGLDDDLLRDGPEYATVSKMQRTAAVPVGFAHSEARNRLMFRR